MSQRQSTSPPVVRFLGEDAGRGGPFALLGLPHVIDGDGAIVKAQQRRLRQIDCHPHRTTPDADEVRLAIHSAVSQLLDPRLRKELALRWPEGNPVDLPKAWRTKRSIQRLSPAFIRKVRLVVGASGGWNATARMRLAQLARVNQLSALEIVGALKNDRERASAGNNENKPSSYDLPPVPRHGGWAGAYLLLATLAILLVVTVAFDTTREPDQSVELEMPEIAGLSPAELASLRGDDAAGERMQFTHYTAIAHELDMLAAKAQVEPEESIDRFGMIYALFLEQWTSFPRQALQRTATNVSVYIERLDMAGRFGPDVVESMRIDTDKPLLVAGSAAMLDLIRSSTQLSQQVRSDLRGERMALIAASTNPRNELIPLLRDILSYQGTSFEADDPIWWNSWLEGVEYVAGTDTEARTRFVLDALSQRLRSSSPVTDAWETTAGMLVTTLDWRGQSPEQFWLVSQFNDTEVPTGRLSVLTESLVRSSSADGVNATMVLRRNANDPKRHQLARLYRETWFPSSESSENQADSETDPLLTMLRLEVASGVQQEVTERSIDSLLLLTNLTTAANLRYSGLHALSEELVQNPIGFSQNTQDPVLNLSRDQEDDAWAERAVNCESLTEFRPLLDQLRTKDSIGLNSAHALVFLAGSRTQHEIREAALQQLSLYRDQVSVLLAVDHMLTPDRVSSREEEVVGKVLTIDFLDRNNPNWYTLVRRELLKRVAESIGKIQVPQADLAEQALRDVFWYRVPDDQRSQLSGKLRLSELAEHLNSRDRVKYAEQTESELPYHSQLIIADANWMAQRSRARSDIERYLAARRYAFNMRTIGLDLLIPGISPRVQSIRSELDARLGASDDIFDQLAQTERAIAEVWIIQIQYGGVQ